MKDFRHKTPIQLRFKDTDMLGHVNNATFATYMETARMNYFLDIVGEVEWEKEEGVIIARIEIDYRLPVLLSDKVSVYTRCSRIGTKSFDLLQLIVRENKSGKEEIAAETKTVVVGYNFPEQKTVPISEERKKKMSDFEEGKILP